MSFANAAARAAFTLVAALSILAPRAASAASHTAAPPAAAAPQWRIDIGMHTQPITGIAADREGRWVATVSTDQTLKIWEAASQKLVRTVLLATTPGAEGLPTALAMSPDGRQVVVAGVRGLPPRLIDRDSGEVRALAAPLEEAVAELVWSPDGRTIAAALAEEGGFRLYDAQTLRLVGGRERLPVAGIDVAAGGRTLVYFFDGSLRLFEPQSGALAQVAAVRLTDFWKPRKPGERTSAWQQPGPGVVRIAPDGQRAAVARVGLLRIAIVTLPTLEATAVIAGLPDSAPFGPLAWTAAGDGVLFPNRDWPSRGRDELGLIDLTAPTDRHARAPQSRWRPWSPEGIAGDQTPMPRPRYLATVPQGFVFATAEPSWGLFRLGGGRAERGVRVERQTLPNERWAAGAIADRHVDAAGRAVFAIDAAASPSAQTRWQPMLFDAETASLQRTDRRELERVRDTASGVRIDAATATLWRDDGSGKRLWSVALPAAPVAVATRSDQDELGFVVVRLVDGSWRWFRYADGSEMLAFFVNRDASRWVAWTRSGEAAGDLDLLRRAVPRGGAFALVQARRELTLRPEAVARALAPAAPPPGTPAPEAALLAVARPLSGSVPERDLVPVTLRLGTQATTLQAVDVTINGRAAGRIDVAQMVAASPPPSPSAGAAGAAPQFRFDLRVPNEPAQVALDALFAGGQRASTTLMLSKPRSLRREHDDVTFFNPLTRDMGSCAVRALDPEELERQLRQRLDAVTAQHLGPGRPPRVDFVFPTEVEIGEAMLFAGRVAEAEAWARERLAREPMRVPDSSSDYVNRDALMHRRIALTTLVGRALQAREPQEGERWFSRAHAERLAQWKPASLGCSAEQAAQVGSYCERLRTRLVTSHKAELWGPLHEAGGRLAEAREVYEAARQAYAEGNSPRLDEAQKYARRIDDVDALLALRAGALSEAQRQALRKAPSPAAVLALARAGDAEDAARVAAALRAQFEKKLPKLFQPDHTQRDRCPVAVEVKPDASAAGMAHYVVQPLRDASAALDEGSRVALALLAAGDASGAFRAAEATQAAARAYFGDAHPLTLQAQAALARVQLARGRPAEALTLWRPWAARFTVAIGDQLWGLSEDARRALLRPARANVDGLLASLAAAAQDGTLEPGDVEMAASVALASRGLLTRTAAELNQLARSRTDASTRQLVEELDRARRQLAALVQREGADAEASNAARTRRNELESRLGAQLQARRGDAAPTPKAVLQALQPGEVLVEFLAFRNEDLPVPPAAAGAAAGATAAMREGLLALVGRAGQPMRLVAYPDFASIAKAAADFRKAVDPETTRGADRAERVRRAAMAMHTAAWAPLAAHLQGARRIHVVPDGLLSTVPLHAMVAPEGEPLAASADLRLLHSPRDLIDSSKVVAAAAPNAGPNAGASLVVGAPDFGGQRPAGASRAVTAAASLQGLWFSPLPGALSEAHAVGKLLQSSGRATVLTGAAASKQSVVGAAGAPLLHLATHGYFLDAVRELHSDEDPLQVLSLSGLAFSRANVTVKDERGGSLGHREGLLTALEVTAMDLRRTRLVVLSACETALGRIQSGEGVRGLARAFHEAGAQNVLATLWAVDDDGTREFMESFYRELVAGRSPPEALATVRQAFLAHPRWKDPFFWAPFVLVGR